MNGVYPRKTCIAPLLKSEVIDDCGDKCKSTVLLFNDMSSEMHGRNEMIEKLKDNHKLILFNNRGHFNVSKDQYGHVDREGDDGSQQIITNYMPDPGKCKENFNIDPYTIDMMVEDGKRILDQHGVTGQVDVVGFSLGAFESIGFAAKYPERVRRLAVGKGFSKYHDYMRIGKGIVTGPVFRAAYWLWCNSRQAISSENEYGCNVPLRIVDVYANHVFNMDLGKRQSMVKAPSLVIECTDDFILGTPIDKIPGAKRVQMKSCGHIFHARNDDMYDEVVKFLDQ